MRRHRRASRLVRWILRRSPGVSDGLRRMVQDWTFADPRLPAKALAFHPGETAYLIPKTSRNGGALPVPPEDLWLRYARGAEQYLEVGERRVRRMLDVLGGSGSALQPDARVLDFGCASGIMLRWFTTQAARGEAWGVDIAAAPIVWCQQHLSPPFRFA